MGRRNQAMGFAVYLDQLDRLLGKKRAYDVDVLIAYGEDAAPDAVLRQAQLAAEKGLSVRVQRAGETTIRAREVITV